MDKRELSPQHEISRLGSRAIGRSGRLLPTGVLQDELARIQAEATAVHNALVHERLQARTGERAMKLLKTQRKGVKKSASLITKLEDAAPDAVAEVELALAEQPDADVIYADEGVSDEEGHYRKMFLKPDWSPDLLLSFNYIGRFYFVRASAASSGGGMRMGPGEAGMYDLLLRVTEATANIHHIPEVLCYRFEEGNPSTTDERPASREVPQVLETRGRSTILR